VFVSKLSFKPGEPPFGVADTGFFILGGDGRESVQTSLLIPKRCSPANTSNQDFNVFLTRSDTSKIYHVKSTTTTESFFFAKDSDRKILTVTAKDKKVAVLYPDEIKVFMKAARRRDRKLWIFPRMTLNSLRDHFIASKARRRCLLEKHLRI
jgi:hypothetical protein